MSKVVILENGSREEACKLFDEVKKNITDFNKESVGIRGNIKNSKEGWCVVRTLK